MAVCTFIVIRKNKNRQCWKICTHVKLTTTEPFSLPQRSELPGYENPENVKAKRCGLDTSGQTLASILLLTGTLPEALHFPFLPYIDHCVSRPRMNDFVEKDRLFMLTLWK